MCEALCASMWQRQTVTLPKVFKLSGCLGPAARQKAEHAARNALQLTTCKQRNATLNPPQFAPSKRLNNSVSEKKINELLPRLIQKPVREAKMHLVRFIKQ